MCSNRTLQISLLPSEFPSSRRQPQQTAQGSPFQGCDLSPLRRDSKWTTGTQDTLKAHPHVPGLISLFLPTLLLPAVFNPCSQKAKDPAASASASASQSLFIINFIKGLGSPASFHVPDSGEVMTVITAKVLSNGRRNAHWCACVCMCAYMYTCVCVCERERRER